MALLELQHVSKHFGGVRALDDVSLEVASGTVHAIIGENGAGKSTLGRIVAGVLSADGGRMLLNGAPTSFRSPREALDHGVAAIAQEPSLVPQLTVADVFARPIQIWPYGRVSTFPAKLAPAS